jgi:hypothetical protein
MSTFKQDHDAVEERVRQAETEATSACEYLRFLELHRELLPVESNRNIIAQYFAGEPFTLEALEEAIQNPGLRKQLSFRTAEEDRASSLATIKRISGDIPITAQYQDNAALARKAAELEDRRILRQKSPAELRQILNDNRPAPVGYPALPVETTRTVLLKMSPADLKMTLRKFGQENVNRRLAGQP